MDEVLVYRGASVWPLKDVWVLAYWAHMHRYERNRRMGPRPKVQHGGWYRSRVRELLGWQAQFGAHRCYPVGGGPLFWTEIMAAIH